MTQVNEHNSPKSFWTYSFKEVLQIWVFRTDRLELSEQSIKVRRAGCWKRSLSRKTGFVAECALKHVHVHFVLWLTKVAQTAVAFHKHK